MGNGRGASFGFRCGQLMPIRESLVNKILGSGVAPKPVKKESRRGIGKHVARVPEVKWRWDRGGATMRMIAAEMGLPYDFVRKVATGETYPHIKAAAPQDERKAA